MSVANISTEFSARIYDDDHGWFVSVGPDLDGLGLCRLAYSEQGAKDREFTIPWEHAEALACAIFDLAPIRKKASLYSADTREVTLGEAKGTTEPNTSSQPNPTVGATGAGE